MFVTRGQERGMRTAKSRSHTEALTRSDDDIRTAFTGRLQKSERQQICGNNRQRARCVGAGYETFQIADRTVGGGILKKGGKNRFLRALIGGTSENPYAKRLGAGLQNGERLRMEICIPVRSQTIVWKFRSASRRPWAISA